MRAKWFFGSTVGAAAVYATVAACGSNSGGRGVPDGGGIIDAALDVATDALDALTNPVPRADAGSGGGCACDPPAVVVAQCDVDIHTTSTYHYAVAKFPGETSATLRGVMAWGIHHDPPSYWPDGYGEQMIAAVLIRDGEVAVMCGIDQTQPFTAVAFVLPNY